VFYIPHDIGTDEALRISGTLNRSLRFPMASVSIRRATLGIP
jgi:hypothetical protein